jgi:hypothetical protein
MGLQGYVHNLTVPHFLHFLILLLSPTLLRSSSFPFLYSSLFFNSFFILTIYPLLFSFFDLSLQTNRLQNKRTRLRKRKFYLFQLCVSELDFWIWKRGFVADLCLDWSRIVGLVIWVVRFILDYDAVVYVGRWWLIGSVGGWWKWFEACVGIGWLLHGLCWIDLWLEFGSVVMSVVFWIVGWWVMVWESIVLRSDELVCVGFCRFMVNWFDDFEVWDWFWKWGCGWIEMMIFFSCYLPVSNTVVVSCRFCNWGIFLCKNCVCVWKLIPLLRPKLIIENGSLIECN